MDAYTYTYYDHGNGGKALFFNVTAVIINLFRAPVVLLFIFIIISTSASVAGVAITLSIVLATATYINSQPASESTCDRYIPEGEEASTTLNHHHRHGSGANGL